MSGLIWIQTVCHSNDILERFFSKKTILKTHQHTWSGSKLFVTLMAFLREFFEKDEFENTSAYDRKACKSRQSINGGGIKNPQISTFNNMKLGCILLCLSIHYNLNACHCLLWNKKLEFWESDVSPGKTEVIQGKFVKFISLVKGYFREAYQGSMLTF